MYENVTLLYGSGNYLMYLRKSRKDLEDESRGETETLSRHFELLKNVAKRMKINVVKIYAEVVSGESIDSRPEVQALLSDVETGDYDGVLVVEVDRLARGDTSDQGRIAKTFKFSDTLIVTPNKIYDPNDDNDEDYFEFGLFMSRREYKTIKKRLSLGRVASQREGKFIGHTAPYGYERYKLKKEKGWSLKIIPEQANVVRMIYNWYAYGMNNEYVGYRKIADELNRLGIPSATEGEWSAYSIQGILRNPVYAGYIACGRRKPVKQFVEGTLTETRPLNHDYTLYPGRHEAIISKELREVVLARFKSRYADSSTKNRPQQNPLSGLVYCSCCHHLMQRRPYQNKTPDSLICMTKGCKTVSSYLATVEHRVLDALDAWLSECLIKSPDTPPENAEKIALLESSIASLKSELKETIKQIDKQYDLLERGIYSEDMFLERNGMMLNRKKELSDKINQLSLELQEESNRDESMQKLLPALQTIHDAYYQIADPAARNALLKEVIDHIDYTKTEGGRWGNPDSFTIEVFPKINR